MVIVAVTVVLARSRDDQVSAERARDAAAESCRHAIQFEQLVARNARLDEVRRSLGRAEESARTAVRGDGTTWKGLLGGLQSVRIALDADDARAARVGIRTVRAECARVAP